MSRRALRITSRSCWYVRRKKMAAYSGWSTCRNASTMSESVLPPPREPPYKTSNSARRWNSSCGPGCGCHSTRLPVVAIVTCALPHGRVQPVELRVLELPQVLGRFRLHKHGGLVVLRYLPGTCYQLGRGHS